MSVKDALRGFNLPKLANMNEIQEQLQLTIERKQILLTNPWVTGNSTKLKSYELRIKTMHYILLIMNIETMSK
jgi:hypothetical protein